MNKIWKRSLALLLSLVMVVGMLPVNAFAEEVTDGDGETSDHVCEFVDGVCECGETDPNYVPAGESEDDEPQHECVWNAGEVTQAATCQAAGVMTYTCTVEGCGKTKTEEIPVNADAHNYVDGQCACGEYEVVVVDEDIDEEVNYVVYIGSQGYESLDAALTAAQTDGLTEVEITVAGNIALSTAVKNFTKVTFNGTDRAQTIDLNLNASFEDDVELVFNNLTVSRLDKEWLYHWFYVKGGLTYKNCKMIGLFNVTAQDTDFNQCDFYNDDSFGDGNYSLWLYNCAEGVEVNVTNCSFDVYERAIKIYGNGYTGTMTLNITGTTFKSRTVDKTVVEMACDNGTGSMNLSIANSTATGFGAPEHIEGATNAWFNVEGTSTLSTVTVDGNVVYTDVKSTTYVAYIGTQGYETLQAAVNAVKNGETITLAADVTEASVTIETSNLAFTIDGRNHKFTGGLDIGIGEELTIQNVDFVASAEISPAYFIDSMDKNSNCVLTVKDCTFTDTDYTTAAVGTHQPTSVLIQGCTATGVHSLLQNEGGRNITVKKTTVTGKRGMSLGTVIGATVEGVTINASDDKYGIRLNGENANNTITIKDSTISAFIPVVVRNAEVENYNIVFEGTNTMNAKNTNDIWCAIGTSEYEENNSLPSAQTGKVTVTLNDAGLAKGVYGMYVEPVTTIDLSESSVTITEPGEYVVNGYNGTNTLTVNTDGNVKITLNGVTINAPADASAISIESGDVTIVSTGSTNSLNGGDNGAGIYVAADASVTITGDADLNATGNGGTDDASGAAGIGGAYGKGDSGEITIAMESNDVKVIAIGYGVWASGIGSAGGYADDITITTGNVYAKGGYYSEGGALQTSYGSGDPEGGAGIGGGSKSGAGVGTITISDSVVTAYGGSKAAGIGAMFWNSVEAINITNSNVTAYGGSSSAAIGTSRAGSGVTADINISGSTVVAEGGAYGAAIGGGYNADSSTSLPKISISIEGSNITATGGEGSAAIGGGYKTDNVNIKIESSTIDATAGALVSGKTVEQGGAASAIGSGANGSGTFENDGKVEIVGDSKITVEAYEDGKSAIAGTDNDKLGSNVTLTEVKNTANVPTGTFNGGMVNVENADRTYLTLDSSNVYATKSIVIEVYDENGKLLVTTSLVDHGDILGNKFPTLNTMVGINCTDSYWDTEWKILDADHVPAYGILYVDGNEMNSAKIQMITTGNEQAINWADVPGVSKTYVAYIGEQGYETLAEALEAAKGETNIVIDLKADATLDVTAWQDLAIGGDTTETITINGNGNTLTFNHLNSDWNNVATNNDAKLILNNMTITNSGYNDSAWNRHDINFACDVELNNVTSDVALAFKADATLKNVKITDNSGSVYGIWVQANGQTISIDGLILTAERGIKIDEQYVTAANVDLSIANATFNTTKKAAIMVKSAAGADITVGEKVDISNVEADKTNAVWVDEDAGATYGNVSVNGETAVMENMPAFVASVVSDGILGYYKTVQAAIDAANDGDTIMLISGENVISMAGVVCGKTVTITGTAVVDWTQGNLWIGREGEGDGNVIFENAKITSSVKKTIASYGIHVSGCNKKSTTTHNGTLVIKDSTIELDYLINRNEVSLENSSLTVYGGYYTHGRNSEDSASGNDETATLTIDAASSMTVVNENTMGIGNESYGVMNVYGSYTANQLNVQSNGTVNIYGTVEITGTVKNDGVINLAAAGATMTAAEGLNVTSTVTGYAVDYTDGVYTLVNKPSADMTYSAYGFAVSGEEGTDSYRERFAIDLYNINAQTSLVVKLYDKDDNLIVTTSRLAKDRDDASVDLIPVHADSTTVNIVVKGRPAGSWDSVWAVEPSVAYIPYKAEIYADNELVDTFVDAFGADDVLAYGALPSVAKAASVSDADGNVIGYYMSLTEALNAAKAGETVTLLADAEITTITIDKAITLDLGDNTLTTTGAYGGLLLKGGCSLKNGTLIHDGTTAAIKAWDVEAIEGVDIVVNAKENKIIGGIVIQKDAAGIDTIKDVNIKGATNGIETYNCGNATDPVIGSMENVKIEATETGMLISARCGTATNCSISGGTTGIKLWIKGTYSATLDLVGCTVSGGERAVYIHDEFHTGDIENNGELKLTADKATTFTSNTDVLVTKTIARAEDVTVDDVIERTVARVGDDYYTTLADAIAAASETDTVTLVADIELTGSITVAKGETLTLDLNGHELSGTDTTTSNFGLIQNNGTLTIEDSSKDQTGKITLTATIDSDWNRYSAVISNNPGGTLVVDGGTIEHLGGTDMAYGIDSLTNNGNGNVSVTINGGTVKSTYRAIRQFLNSTTDENELTVNGGTITGDNAAIFFHDPNAKANNGTITVGADAEVNGNVYLFVTAGSTEWPVNVSIADAALQGESTVTSKNVPTGYEVVLEEGIWSVKEVDHVAWNVKTETYYETVSEALAAAETGETVQLLKDCTDGYVIVTPGITLDLNGKLLTANCVVGFNGSYVVDDSESNAGRLKVAKSNMSLASDNKQLPIYDGSGYAFVEVIKYNQKMKTENKYVFQPVYEAYAHELLLLGSEVTGVKIVVRMSWTTDSGSVEQDFVYTDEQMRQVVSSYNPGTGRYGSQYALTLTSVDSDDFNLKSGMVTVSGVELLSSYVK